jgi:hypothetical protein
MTDVVERLRMAVAEAGFDPSGIEDGGMVDDNERLVFDFGGVPLPVKWRARELAELNGPVCWTCYKTDFARNGWFLGRCLADRRLNEDCGASR